MAFSVNGNGPFLTDAGTGKRGGSASCLSLNPNALIPKSTITRRAARPVFRKRDHLGQPGTQFAESCQNADVSALVAMRASDRRSYTRNEPGKYVDLSSDASIKRELVTGVRCAIDARDTILATRNSRTAPANVAPSVSCPFNDDLLHGRRAMTRGALVPGACLSSLQAGTGHPTAGKLWGQPSEGPSTNFRVL